MPVKKVLLLSVSAGVGHMRAAEATRAYAGLHEIGIEATHLDVINFCPEWFQKALYRFLHRVG